MALIEDDARVVLSVREPFGLGLALAARKEDLRGVDLYTLAPSFDFGWYDEGWSENFNVTIGYPTGIGREATDAGRLDIYPGSMFPSLAPLPYVTGEIQADYYLVEVSPPDENGFCSFGVALWDKRQLVQNSRTVIAEVSENLIRTFGDNYVHVSEIDYFVPHVSTGREPGKVGTLAGREVKPPEPYLKNIADYVAEMISDGDTIQIGVGRTTEALVRMGLLDDKRDLGFHSELTVPGIIPLIQRGVINGSRKPINTRKVVTTSVGGGSIAETNWVHLNPLFDLVESHKLLDVRVVAAHDHFVAVNNILMVDITGQVAAESVGHRLLGQAGGQMVFVVGAWHAANGRSIQVMPSTAQNGSVSRVVPVLPEGTVVTTPRNIVDKVVTEYGVADLKGKSLRHRAEALIAIAHPDFRDELRRHAKRILGG